VDSEFDHHEPILACRGLVAGRHQTRSGSGLYRRQQSRSGFDLHNGGVTWTTNSMIGFWDAISVSADGNRLALAGSQGSGTWISTNFGATWISNDVPQGSLVGQAFSADGGKIT